MVTPSSSRTGSRITQLVALVLLLGEMFSESVTWPALSPEIPKRMRNVGVWESLVAHESPRRYA